MRDIYEQLRDSDIPYPAKWKLFWEMKYDLETLNIQDPAPLEKNNIDDLVEVHATGMFKLLKIFGAAKTLAELVVVYSPILILIVALFKEDAMITFMEEGGLGMYVVLVIGLFLLGKEILHSFRVLLVKDHSEKNLNIESMSFLLCCLGFICLSIGCSVHDLYVMIGKQTMLEFEIMPLIVGLKESLTPIILCAFLVSMTLFMRAGTRTLLKKWHAPIPA